MRLCNNIKYRSRRIGCYSLVKLIGEGRYGMCFLASLDNGEKVVIKKFKRGFFKSDYQKNIGEAVILSKLKDKRIPELLGIINEKGFYGFVLNFIEGYTFKELLFKGNYQFSGEEFYNIGLKLIAIIEYLHERGIIHGDLSLSNILLHNEEVYLLDFGLARCADPVQYTYKLDFSYMAEFLLYLLYSSYKPKSKNKKLPWYEELPLSFEQITFLKKLFGIDHEYESIHDIRDDFTAVFKPVS